MRVRTTSCSLYQKDSPILTCRIGSGELNDFGSMPVFVMQTSSYTDSVH